MRKRFFILPLFSLGKVWYDVTGLQVCALDTLTVRKYRPGQNRW